MVYNEKQYQKQYQAEYYQRNKDRINEYRKDYNKNVTRQNKKQFGAYVDKDIMEEFEKKLLKDGLSKAEFLRNVITEYLKK